MTTERVLVVPVQELEKQGITPQDILQQIDVCKLDSQAYGYLPRHVIDDKSPKSVEAGKLYPQVLPYNLLIDVNTKSVLVYQRKGKEEGLLGKWSLGVGGHITDEDSVEMGITSITDLIAVGATREFVEETGLMSDILVDDYTRCILSYRDLTSTVHLGLVSFIEVEDFSELDLAPSEFLNYGWMTLQELKDSDKEWETWSDIIIKSLTNEF